MELSQEYLPKMQAAFSGGVVPVGTCRKYAPLFLSVHTLGP